MAVMKNDIAVIKDIEKDKSLIFNTWRYLFNNFFKNDNIYFEEQWFNNLFNAIEYALMDQIDYSLLNFSIEDVWKEEYELFSMEKVRVESFIDFIGACLAVVSPYLNIEENRRIWYLKNFICFSLMLSSHDDVITSLRYKDYIIEDLNIFILFLNCNMEVLWMNEKSVELFPEVVKGRECTVDFINSNLEKNDLFQGFKNSLFNSNAEKIEYIVKRVNGFYLICGQKTTDFSKYEEEIYSLRSKLQFLLNSNSIPMLILDTESRVTVCGKAFSDLMKKYGVFQEKFLNKKLSEVDFFSNNAAVFLAMQNYLDNGKNFESMIRGEGGIEFQIIVNPIYDASQEAAVGYILTMRDSPDQAYLDKKCSEYYDMCNRLINAMEDFAIVIDKDFNIIFSNKIAKQIINGEDNLGSINHEVTNHLLNILQSDDFIHEKKEICKFEDSLNVEIRVERLRHNNLLINIKGLYFAVAELKENLWEAQRNWDIFEKELKNKQIGGK